MISSNKKIILAPYCSDWPVMFESVALEIKEVLGSNCLNLYHVGSTSLPGLSAKPVIDIICVVQNPNQAIYPLEGLKFKYKGEYNVPMRFYFSRSEGEAVNLHVYKEGHPEIELNLSFRDYLRSHSEARNEYTSLKENLLKDEASYEKRGSAFTGYNLGKDAFIRKVLKAANFNRIRIMKCTHYAEWNFSRNLRQKYFFDPLSMTDPYAWTFDHQDHSHLILYQGVEMLGYAHIQFWQGQRAALRIFVIDESYRHQGIGSQFLELCELWLKSKGIKSIHHKARPEALRFFRKNGFSDIPFDDPSGEPPCPQEVAVGKKYEF